MSYNILETVKDVLIFGCLIKRRFRKEKTGYHQKKE